MKPFDEIKHGLEAIIDTESALRPEHTTEIDGIDCYYSDIIINAIDYIELLESKQQRWLSTSGEHLPAHVQCDCLIYIDGEVKPAIWDHAPYSRSWHFYADEDHVTDDICICGDITHWMPLPDEPKAGETLCD